jgi:Tol biopolymer transport system component/DNA-binding winged helix-turn-helix (wHTH) protein
MSIVASTIYGDQVLECDSPSEDVGEMLERLRSRRIKIGSVELEPESGHIWQDGVRSYLPEQPLAILQALLDARGGVVSRDELRSRLWPDDTFVDFEHGVNAAVKRLREALGDNADSPRFIETVPRRGYRLIAPVEEIADVAAEGEEPGHPPVRARWLVGGVLLLAAAAIAVLGIARQFSGSPKSSGELTRLTHDGGLTTQPSISDDGEVVVYASDRAGDGQLDLWVQRKGGGGPVRLTSDPADDREPSVSPDGGRVAFRSERQGGGIYVMPTHTGGQPTLIAEGGRNPRFSPDGRHIAYSVGFAGMNNDPSPGSKTFVVNATGGHPRQLLPDAVVAFWPVWAPDSKHVLVTADTTEQENEQLDWYVVPIDGGQPVHLKSNLQDKYRFSCIPRQQLWLGDTIIFSVMQTDTFRLWRTRISSAPWQASETAEQLIAGTEHHTFASASSSDRLVFASTTIRQNIWAVPIAAEEGRVLGPIEQLTNGADLDINFGVSLDGTTLSFSSANGRVVSIRVMDVRTRQARIVVPPGPTDWMVLSPDGSRMAYRRLEEPSEGLNVVSARGGEPEHVCTDCGWSIPSGWSHDNRRLFYLSGDTGNMLIHVLDLASGSHRVAAKHPSNHLFNARFSPDDRWMTFQEMLPTQQSRIWVAPVDRATDRKTWIQVTSGEWWDDKPRWSPAGSLLYFMSQRDGFRCIWAQRLEPLSRRPKGTPFAVAHFHNGRISTMNVFLRTFDFGVARDRIVLNLGDITGNIWSTQAPLLHLGQTASLSESLAR